MFEVNRQVEFPAGMNKVLCCCFCSGPSNSHAGTESVFRQSTGPLIKRIQRPFARYLQTWRVCGVTKGRWSRNVATTGRGQYDTHRFLYKRASDPWPPLTSRVRAARARVPGCCLLSRLCLTRICLASLATFGCTWHAGPVMCRRVDAQVIKAELVCSSCNPHTWIVGRCPGNILYKLNAPFFTNMIWL